MTQKQIVEFLERLEGRLDGLEAKQALETQIRRRSAELEGRVTELEKNHAELLYYYGELLRKFGELEVRTARKKSA